MADKKKDVKKEVPGTTDAAKLNRQIDAVLRTEEGRALWAHLAVVCGFFVSSLRRKPDGEIAPLSTECLEAQRYVYIELRKCASRRLLQKAEELAEDPPATPKAKPKPKK